MTVPLGFTYDESTIPMCFVHWTVGSVPGKYHSVAITLGGLDDKNYPRGLVIGTVTKTVAAGGAISRDARLRTCIG